MKPPFRKHNAPAYLIENVDLWTAQGIRRKQNEMVEDGRLKSLQASNVPPGIERIDGEAKC